MATLWIFEIFPSFFFPLFFSPTLGFVGIFSCEFSFGMFFSLGFFFFCSPTLGFFGVTLGDFWEFLGRLFPVVFLGATPF